jgi:two-component system LytT family response regulator
MNKIRALIADDEPLARRGIRQLLQPHDDIEIVGEARNGRETVRALRDLKPDLVFLDIQMPSLDGFGVLRAIGVNQMPSVIFVTAHDEFAVRAFDAHALDYLVKPLKKARFALALERMRERRRSAAVSELSRKLSALLEEREKARGEPRVIVPTSTGNLIINSDEIDWIEADGYYAAIHARNGRHLVRESLASLAERLDPTRFVRVHRAAIVNLDRVNEVRQDGSETVLLLRGGVRVLVSRRRKQVTRRILRRIHD